MSGSALPWLSKSQMSLPLTGWTSVNTMNRPSRETEVGHCWCSCMCINAASPVRGLSVYFRLHGEEDFFIQRVPDSRTHNGRCTDHQGARVAYQIVHPQCAGGDVMR